jgi:hypothetical protein
MTRLRAATPIGRLLARLILFCRRRPPSHHRLQIHRRFIAARPSTILGLIPVGTSRSSYPIENVAGVNAGTRFDILGVIFGAVAVLVGIAGISYPGVQVVAIVLILLGAAAVVGAPKQHIEIMNSGGGTITFPVSVFERGRTLEFANRVSEAIARSSRGALSARDLERPVAASTDATGALRQLDHLRTQGLITEAEFTAKRQDVLNRL